MQKTTKAARLFTSPPDGNKVEYACKLLDYGADLLAQNANGRTPVDVAGTQKVVNTILTYKLGIMSHANDRLSQEVRVMATAFLGNMDRVDSTTTTPSTTSRCLDLIQQQQQQEPVKKSLTQVET
jgi:hypothetical protein